MRAAIVTLLLVALGRATSAVQEPARGTSAIRGPFVNATFARLDAAACVFIGAHSTPTFVFSIGWSV